MSPDMIGNCESSAHTFKIEIFHCGFGDTCYAYCDRCGRTAILSLWSKQWPAGVKGTQAEIPAEMEQHLAACECGGRFAKGNSPRCPSCNEPLSANKAAEYLEAQAPGAKLGWRWQRNWTGLYCAVIDCKQVLDNFKG